MASERDPLEELAAEYIERLRRGETPVIAEYQRQHPALAAEIRALFPLMASLEKLKPAPALNSATATFAKAVASRQVQLGEFTVLHELGRGAMGVVYEAEQPSLQRRVAIRSCHACPRSSPKPSSARSSASCARPTLPPVCRIRTSSRYSRAAKITA
jgi:hypothetical protein